MIRIIEELSLNAWPALQTMLYDGWVLRFANGYTRRANSVNLLYPSNDDLGAKIATCERFYRDKGLSTVFKLTAESCPRELDEVLASRGYALDALTSVQLLDLSDWTAAGIPGLILTESLTEAWFDAFCRASNLAAERRPTAWRMLQAIVPAPAFAAILADGETIACGLAVAQGTYVGFYDIVTAPHHRRRGHGERLMSGLLQWGREKGATTAYLQVMTNNPPALALYAKLGFSEIYRYWYRVKA